ncbi:TetR-like C-terminal domain-containing protein [Streptomyces sp. NPDC056411]|uniref:TetR-like C-terminal domain-containing protein n=1 Tax=Streptomyces sp. NPDC056411 TaxID=3345813 RepID=UPI0035DC0088
MSAHHAEGGRRPRSSINAVSALASQQSRLEVPDTGSLRGDLLAAPQVLRETFLGPLGLVCLRTAVEAKIYPELFGQAIADLRRMEGLGDTEIQRRAVQRGELAEEATSPLMLKTVIGPLILRYLSTQVDELPDFEAAFDHDAAPLVDFVWTGAAPRTGGAAGENA